MTGAEWQDFCVPDNPETLSQKLIIRDDEIWCLSYHHITPDTQPFARQSWMLNTEIGTLQKLTTLNCFNNALMKAPPDIGKLASLTKLDVSLNKLSTFPPEMAQLGSHRAAIQQDS